MISEHWAELRRKYSMLMQEPTEGRRNSRNILCAKKNSRISIIRSDGNEKGIIFS